MIQLSSRFNRWQVIFLLLIGLTTCNKSGPVDFTLNNKIAGSWVGGLMQNNNLTQDIELRYLKINPDSSLSLSLIYELGPRSRVWEYDIEVTGQDHQISWEAHEGIINDTYDTMHLTKEWKGEKSEWMFYRDKSYDSFIEKLIASQSSENAYSIPPHSTDGLICASLKDVDIAPQIIYSFIEDIINGKHDDLHSVLVYRKGKLVFEKYFALNAKLSGNFIDSIYREKLHQLSSVTKGIVSLSTGLVLEKDNSSSVIEPIYRLLPDYSGHFTEEKKLIQVGHLLTMTSGLKWDQFNYSWNDERNDAAMMYKSEDVVEFILDRPLVSTPGTAFNYTNADPTLLGVILENSSGLSVDLFTDTHLFKPLGINEYQWSKYPDGSLETDGGLKLRPRDLLKIGILMLHRGNWEGEQIVPEFWITESITAENQLSNKRGYAYYWNTMRYNFKDLEYTAIFVPGDGGQFLAIFPDLEMILVFTAGNYSQNSTRVYWNIINNKILPAIN